VIVLGVDSVTVDNNVVVGRESGRPIGEGPGKDGGIELMDLVEVNGRSGWIIGLSDGSSLARREGLDTDSGSSTFLAVTLVTLDDLDEVVGMLPMSEGELTLEKSSRGWRGNSRSIMVIGSSGKGSGDLARGVSTCSGTGIGISSASTAG
jgi:hypothetical protein